MYQCQRSCRVTKRGGTPWLCSRRGIVSVQLYARRAEQYKAERTAQTLIGQCRPMMRGLSKKRCEKACINNGTADRSSYKPLHHFAYFAVKSGMVRACVVLSWAEH